MLAAFSAQAAFAADTVTIKAGEATAKAGENFTLEISLGDVPAQGISAIEFAVTYDAKVATVSGVSAGKIANNGVDDAEKFDGVTVFEAGKDTAGLVTITYSTGLSDAKYCITESGVFATITGTVAAGTADGEYPVTITAISRETVEGKGDTNKEIKAGYIAADGTLTKYSTTTVDGKIIVGDGGTTETTAPAEETKPAETTAPAEDTTAPAEETTKPDEEQKDTTEPATGTPVNPDVKATLYGDANVDGSVDILDVIKLNKFLLGNDKLTDEGKANADVDANKAIDTTDSLNILKCVVEMIEQSSFPLS
jgi:hypothetical protein